MRSDNALLAEASRRVAECEANARAFSIAGEVLAALAYVCAIAGLLYLALNLGVV